MSYVNNEHYLWIESNCKVKCSPLGKTVANILGYVGGGIYNAPINSHKVDWNDNYCLEVAWEGSLANWDFRKLTLLVVECHRRLIRVEISPLNFRNIKLMFWKRETRDREAGTSARLPDIEEMIALQDAEWEGQDRL